MWLGPFICNFTLKFYCLCLHPMFNLWAWSLELSWLHSFCPFCLIHLAVLHGLRGISIKCSTLMVAWWKIVCHWLFWWTHQGFSSMLEFWTGFSELDKSCIWTFSGCNNEEWDIFIANLACYMHISSPVVLLKTSVHLCHHLKVADDICREWFLFWRRVLLAKDITVLY